MAMARWLHERPDCADGRGNEYGIRSKASSKGRPGTAQLRRMEDDRREVGGRRRSGKRVLWCKLPGFRSNASSSCRIPAGCRRSRQSRSRRSRDSAASAVRSSPAHIGCGPEMRRMDVAPDGKPLGGVFPGPDFPAVRGHLFGSVLLRSVLGAAVSVTRSYWTMEIQEG